MPRREGCRYSSDRARRCRSLSPRPFRVIALQHGPWYPCSYKGRVTLVRCRLQFPKHKPLLQLSFSFHPHFSPEGWPGPYALRLVKLIRSHRTSISSSLRGTPAASAMSRRSPRLCSSASCQSRRAARIVACSRSVIEIWECRLFGFDIAAFLHQLRDLDTFCQINSNCFIAILLGYIEDGRGRILALL